jgi:hypothetical protein
MARSDRPLLRALGKEVLSGPVVTASHLQDLMTGLVVVGQRGSA